MASCQRVQDYCSSLVFQCFGISTLKSRPSITSDRSPEVNQRKLYSRQNTQKAKAGNAKINEKHHALWETSKNLGGTIHKTNLRTLLREIEVTIEIVLSYEFGSWNPPRPARPVASAKMILVLAQCLVCFHAENTMWLCMYTYIYIHTYLNWMW